MNPDFSKLKKVPNDLESTCFACGKKNPLGFHLEFFSDDEKVYSKYTIPEQFSGWSNLTHGGILATLLDETMAWTAIYLKKKYILTKSLQINFKKPVLTGSEVLMVGYVQEMISKREISVRALLLNELSEICADATGSIVIFAPDSFAQLKITGNEFLERFDREVFQKIIKDQDGMDA